MEQQKVVKLTRDVPKKTYGEGEDTNDFEEEVITLKFEDVYTQGYNDGFEKGYDEAIIIAFLYGAKCAKCATKRT